MIKDKKAESVTVAFRMNKKVWKESKKCLESAHISRSQFIGLVLSEVVRECKEGEGEMIDRIKDSLMWMGTYMMVRKKE